MVSAEPGRRARGFGSAGPAELRRIPRLLVMPCSPPLHPKRTTPPFLPSDRGGEFARGGKQIARSHPHSIVRNKNACLETVPRARVSTPIFHHPTLPPLLKGGTTRNGIRMKTRLVQDGLLLITPPPPPCDPSRVPMTSPALCVGARSMSKSTRLNYAATTGSQSLAIASSPTQP